MKDQKDFFEVSLISGIALFFSFILALFTWL